MRRQEAKKQEPFAISVVPNDKRSEALKCVSGNTLICHFLHCRGLHAMNYAFASSQRSVDLRIGLFVSSVMPMPTTRQQEEKVWGGGGGRWWGGGP